jgi:predicted histidine transporter YuiF (NhaC family)
MRFTPAELGEYPPEAAAFTGAGEIAALFTRLNSAMMGLSHIFLVGGGTALGNSRQKAQDSTIGNLSDLQLPALAYHPVLVGTLKQLQKW